MKIYLLASVLGFLVSGFASAAIKCDAYAGMNRYHFGVEFDRETGLLSISTDDGMRAKGSATTTTSARSDIEYVFLGTGFGLGFELQIPGERRGGDPLLCVKPNECYRCK